MRIENGERLDILWFARDTEGYLVLANSRGGSVPEFALASAENTIRFAEQFCSLDAVAVRRDLPLDVDKMTSVYGLTCYVTGDAPGEGYRVAGRPAKRRTRFQDLPEHLRQLIPDSRLPFRAAETGSFRVCGSQFFDIEPETRQL